MSKYDFEYQDLNLNLNSLLVKRQIDNPSQGAVTGGNWSLALTREVNFDTLSSDSSEEERMRYSAQIRMSNMISNVKM